MKITELAGCDVIRRGSKHDVFIGMSRSPRAYSTKAQTIWFLEDGEFSIEETDWEAEVEFMSSYRNSNINRLAGVFGDYNVHVY